MSLVSKAVTRYVRLSPKRSRLVADLVRGKMAQAAKVLLAHTNKKAARHIEKTLTSAIAIAETQKGIRPENLVISTLLIDEAARLRRAKAANKGRSTPIRKPTVHITVELSEMVTRG
ncbi:MAG: 50S ribosomal protein L22 [Chlamydiia bacterium]